MGEAVSSTPRPEVPTEAPLALEAWEGLEQTDEFKQLVRSRWRFVVPATIFFMVYYFLLPILNGTATAFMRTEVIGHINIAYLFALSQFVVAWVLAWLYIRRANNVFDPLAEKVRERARQSRIPVVEHEGEREVTP
jgi:uncharacterized membrane protein (DUF485 family)